MAIVDDLPARPDGVELIGEMEGSGYRTPPALVRRPDGQTLQLTPLLYAILEAADGQRGYADIARHVSERTGRVIAAADVEALADRQLRPRGLLLGADGTVPSAVERSNPLTGLRLKVAVTDPAVTRRLTEPFAALFHPWVWVPLVLAFGWIAWWILTERGFASAAYQAFAKPDLLLVVLVVTVLSAGFHEFGHAAAARRGGARPGAMGAGWFLLWPAFYTDVTDTYRLDRAARIRTDLGGLYFNAIVTVAIAIAWWATGWDAMLLVVAAQILQMIRQLAPLVRFDGYHVLADVTGVPDLFSRMGPILASLWPGRRNDPRVAQLKWWVRLMVTAWVIVVVPLLLVSVVALVLAAPRLVGTALAGLVREWQRLGPHLSDGEVVDAVGALLAMAIIALPILAITVVFGRIVLGVARGVWGRTEGRPLGRASAGATAMALAAALAIAWWPISDRYDPIQPYERGTLADVANMSLSVSDSHRTPSSSHGGEVVTVLPGSVPLPTEDEPQLALVLVPAAASVGDPAEAWIFPFNEPLPPEPGDNQALSVNTADGTVTYDVAIAWVWATDENPVLNVNEAYAFASCSDCVTVAVAFQVVIIVGSADVVVPQNLSAAINYECFACITAAIASQLVITIEALPSQEQQIALADLWEEITALAASIPTLPLADVLTRLDEYKQEILAILGVAAQIEASSAPLPSGSARPTPSSASTSSHSPEPAASPTALSTPVPTSSLPTATPTGTPIGEPPPSPTPGATTQATTPAEPNPSASGS